MNFLSGIDISDILYPGGDRDCGGSGPQPAYGDIFCRNGKICVGQAVAEAVTHRNVKGIKVPVAYIDAFLIFFLVYIAALETEIVCVGIILIIQRPGIRHFPGGRHSSGENIGQGISAFLSGLDKLNDGYDAGIILCKTKIHQSAGINNQDNLFISGADLSDLLPLFFCNVIVARHIMTVRVFSGNAGKYVDRGVRPVGPGSGFVNGSACGNGKWRGGISLEEISAAFFLCLPENLISPVLPGLLIAGFIVGQPCGRRLCDLKSPVFQTLINIYVCSGCLHHRNRCRP